MTTKTQKQFTVGQLLEQLEALSDAGWHDAVVRVWDDSDNGWVPMDSISFGLNPFDRVDLYKDDFPEDENQELNPDE